MIRFVQHKKFSGPVICALVIAVFLSGIYARIRYRDVSSFFLQISMISSVDGTAALYFDTGNGYSDREVEQSFIQLSHQYLEYDFPLPRKTVQSLRFDPLQTSGEVAIRSITVINSFDKSRFPIDLHQLRPLHQIQSFDLKDHTVIVTVEDHANDPQLAIDLSSPLTLDSLRFFPLRLFLGDLSGGFLILFITMFLLILILKKFCILVDFFDHPGRTSFNWIQQNKLLFIVMLCTLAFRVFFILTYPLDMCSDAYVYYQLIHKGIGTLVHATGYPYFMHFFSSFLPTKVDLLIFQYVIDFGAQLVLMIFLNKRFGLVATVTAGLLYGLELGTISWVSRSTPEWMQGIFFALAFMGAIEAYVAKRPAKKILLYLLSAWLFTWSFLMKFLTVVMLPIYLILFVLEGKKWKGRWFSFATMSLIIFVQISFFIYFYHFPSTGTKALTHDVGRILSEKVDSFLPAGHHFSESGRWSKRYCILISEMPGSSADINIDAVYRHVDAVPRSVRKPYQERYHELITKSDSELQYIINTKQYLRGLDQNFLIANFYLGLSETDNLLMNVFLEAAITYPMEYVSHVISGIKESFFMKTRYNMAIIHNPFSSNQDHPFQINRDDIIHHLPWGYALFNVSPHVRCMYDEPVFLKTGLQFFTFWGEFVYIPTIIKWLVIVLAMVLLCIEFKKDKIIRPAVIYLSMGTLVIFMLISLSSAIFVFRYKEFLVYQHLLSILVGISVSSMVSFGKSRWFGDQGTIVP